MTTPEEYRTQLERYLWEATQWQGESTLIEQMLDTADKYAHDLAAVIAESMPPVVVFAEPEPEPTAIDLTAVEESGWGQVDFDALIEELDRPAQPVPELVELFSRPDVTPSADSEILTMIMDIPAPEKDCRGCGTSKTLDEFHKDRQNQDGLRYLCKTCDADAKRDWRRRDLQRRALERAAFEELERQREGVSGDHARCCAPTG